jgi:hypothetical protein
MIVSGILLMTGIYLLGSMDMDTPRYLLTIYMIILGLGVGFSFSLLNLASINGVSPMQRGAATSMNSTFRTIGMTLGITIFGTIQQRIFESKLTSLLPGSSPFMNQSADHAQLSSQAIAQMPPQVASAFKEALTSSITTSFLWALVPAVFAFLCILLMGNEKMQGFEGAPTKETAEKKNLHPQEV